MGRLLGLTLLIESRFGRGCSGVDGLAGLHFQIVSGDVLGGNETDSQSNDGNENGFHDGRFFPGVNGFIYSASNTNGKRASCSQRDKPEKDRGASKNRG